MYYVKNLAEAESFEDILSTNIHISVQLRKFVDKMFNKRIINIPMLKYASAL